MEKLNQYHRQAIAKKMKSIAYWRKHPMSREECLNQFKQLREQRYGNPRFRGYAGTVPASRRGWCGRRGSC